MEYRDEHDQLSVQLQEMARGLKTAKVQIASDLRKESETWAGGFRERIGALTEQVKVNAESVHASKKEMQASIEAGLQKQDTKL